MNCKIYKNRTYILENRLEMRKNLTKIFIKVLVRRKMKKKTVSKKPLLYRGLEILRKDNTC